MSSSVWTRIFVAGGVISALAGSASAIDPEITYQGYIEDAFGPLNSPGDQPELRFRLYTDPGGVGLVDEIVKAPGSVTFEDGLFTTTLDFGSTSPFDGTQLWVEIVADGTPLSPIQKLTASPYSLATRGIYVSDGGRVAIGGYGEEARLTILSGDNSVPSLYLPDNTKDIAWPSAQTLQLGHWNEGGQSFTQRMQISEDGRVGIGGDPTNYGLLVVRQTSDSANTGLAVRSTGSRSMRLWIDPDDDRSRIDCGASGTGPIVLNAGGGQVAIGDTSPLWSAFNIETATEPSVGSTAIGAAAHFSLTSTTSDHPAVSVRSSSADGPAMWVWNTNSGGGAVFEGSPAVSAEGSVNAYGVHASASAQPGAGGAAIYATFTGVGTDGAAIIANANVDPSDDIALFQRTSFTVARIGATGRGYFNDGTQTGGADVAEFFAVEGERAGYEPGDLLVISTESDRTVTLSSEPYSTLVAGVHATKPGVLLTERHVDADHADMVPMGVVGVVPTKVSAENGPIRRGDLLVSSSTPGHAMKGTDRSRMLGAIVGKALEGFDGPGTGTIRVMVTPR